MEGSQSPGGFLPPEPQGPEPDLGAGPQPAPPTQPQAAPQAPQAPQAPAWGTPQPAAPDNGAAVLGFCLSISSLGLLFISAGLSTIVSVGLAIPGMLQSRKGRRVVESGTTNKNGGLAMAGWVIGIISLVLAVLATLFWIIIAVVVATNEEARDEFEREFDRQYEQSSTITAVAVAVRAIGLALS